MKGWTLAVSYGSYGGFYWFNGYSTRICLGWIAFTFIPKDFDLIFGDKSMDVIRPSEWAIEQDGDVTNVRRK